MYNLKIEMGRWTTNKTFNTPEAAHRAARAAKLSGARAITLTQDNAHTRALALYYKYS